MTSEQSQQSSPAEAWLQASQNFMQGFFDQVSRTQNSIQGAAAMPSPLASLTGAEQERLTQLQREHIEQHARLWAGVAQRKPGEAAEPIIPAPSGDRRFNAPEWSDSPVYDYLRQAYWINSQFLSNVSEALPLTDRVAKSRFQFLTQHYIDAMAPCNFAATNPEVVQKAIETKGESLTRGLLNLIADVEKGSISMTDDSAFEVGRNLATTDGAVIFENELMQLLQYAPLTDKVCSRPLLVVPPCINKYYILDLQKENSFVRYAVEQGITVFLISWRNPKAEQGNLGWDDYVESGVLQALDIVRSVSKTAKPNVLGFCVGGTLLATALSAAYAKGENPVESVSFLAAMLDFADTGDISCFVDETTVAAREASIGKGGLMTGRELMNVFSTLRPNDLIWNYVVDNYLKGNKPTAFDILYWNADCTNLPGPFAAWYLRNTYLENNLRVPGKLKVTGEALDMGRITCPSYFIATREDHIVPWRTAFLGRRLMGGESTFVLGASGHVAGIVNHPVKNKRSYWTNVMSATTSEEWMESAVEHKGSWWPNWMDWLKSRSGELVAAPTKPGNRQYKVIEAAPGRYVKERA
ncbi:class I poly(R)-hydroxyalkanoic acid synthase [Uliginosibacterium gangwonense]|uniref:class I poly(R)-hydroxyalkanoic acid synthase n=1 Tax=Uliginosibacterium gangwonense TaxID=392736 RepID=UPI000361E164|nr:class I poly(R)-hydroxyalkanoic acid synthase [Uliginosibacterium gangwonense]